MEFYEDCGYPDSMETTNGRDDEQGMGGTWEGYSRVLVIALSGAHDESRK